MNFIIFDLEATCWPDKSHTSEIIEIGAVKINENKEIVDEFCHFIKPILNPVLSDFCTELTSIEQKCIDNAEGFPSVINEFKDWIGVSNNDYYLCSWGFYDRKQLIQDSKLHLIDFNWVHKHISIKHQHQKINGLKRPIGLGNAIDFEDMKFEGTAHRGIDDARNIAKIFIRYFGEWEYDASC